MVCPSCLQELEHSKQALGCRRCTAVQNEYETDPPLCEQCLREPPLWQSARSSYHYQSGIKVLMWNFKFHQNFASGKVLAQLWVDDLKQLLTDKTLAHPQALIPVPLHWRRQMKRGFNQSEYLAEQLGCALNIKVDSAFCKRIRATRHQSHLSRPERLNNLKGAFKVSSGQTYAHIAIIDDVMTTGSTLSELARCLLHSGQVKQVSVWCLAGKDDH